jgi:hypothetical protein
LKHFDSAKKRNRFRQKEGEIEAFRALEIGAAKLCKEHIPRKGNGPTYEVLLLLDGHGIVEGKTIFFMGVSRVKGEGLPTAPKRSNFSNLH